MAGALERYDKLGLGVSLYRVYQYPSACRELSLILRLAYSKLPKHLQSLVFQDTLTAFRLLPEMETQTAISAANLLLQGAEGVLPKQKKNLAVTEFKHAMVTYKRRCKARRDEEDLTQLPQDVLAHVFRFLDLQSLVSAALVCRSWNLASSDNHLWQLLYVVYFSNCNSGPEIMSRWDGLIDTQKSYVSQPFSGVNLDWKAAFKNRYRGSSSKKFLTTSRGYCEHCGAIIWLSDFSNECHGINCKIHFIKPVSAQQIVEFLVNDTMLIGSSSDSDSDSEDVTISKLWAFPRSVRKVSL